MEDKISLIAQAIRALSYKEMMDLAKELVEVYENGGDEFEDITVPADMASFINEWAKDRE